MLPRLAAAFERRFGRAPELAARAPGRVNLIGEHTDYNEGWVLPCALDRATLAVGARRADRRLRCFSLDEPEAGEIDPAALEAGRGWLDYVQGVLAALAERGLEAPGLDLGVASDVPRGSGLSSSAALTVALSTLLDLAGGLRLGPLERARLAHRAENGFVGVACGLMDPLASALGQRGHALLIDCRSVEIRPVPSLPAYGSWWRTPASAGGSLPATTTGAGRSARRRSPGPGRRARSRRRRARSATRRRRTCRASRPRSRRPSSAACGTW